MIRAALVASIALLAGCGGALGETPGSMIESGLTESQFRSCGGVEVRDRAGEVAQPQPQVDTDIVEVDAQGKTITRDPPPREEVSVMPFSLADVPHGERTEPLEQSAAPQTVTGVPPKEISVDESEATCIVRFAERSPGVGKLRIRDAQATSSRGLSITRGGADGCVLGARWETLSRETNTYEIVDGWVDAKTCGVSVARRQAIKTMPIPGGLYFGFVECGKAGCDAPHLVLLGPSSHAPEAVATSALVTPDRADLPFVVEQLELRRGEGASLDRLVGPATIDAWLGRRKRHQMVALRVGVDVSQGVSEKAATAVFHAAPFVAEPRARNDGRDNNPPTANQMEE